MLQNVIENYLTSIREVEFYIPFTQLLRSNDFYDVHIIHGTTEFGKDIIAKKIENGMEIQYYFPVKIGNVNYKRFTQDIKPQLLECITNKLSHPNYNNKNRKIISVITGSLNSMALISFQEFNEYIEKTLNDSKIVLWDKEYLISFIFNASLDPFFSNRNVNFLANFINFYSRILNNSYIDFMDIEEYTRKWLNINISDKVYVSELFFEAFFFCKLLREKKCYYEAVLILSGFIRVLLYLKIIDLYEDELNEILSEIILDFSNEYNESFSTKITFNFGFPKGIFEIIYYNISCLRSLELLSIYVLLINKENRIKTDFVNLLINHKGCYRPISDNYAITIYLIGLTLIKINQVELLKKYLINVTVWICDKYDDIGISHFGSNLQVEMEQLFSEKLEGLEFTKMNTSFCANVILDLCYILQDKELYQKISNDFRAVEIILDCYHVFEEKSLFNFPEANIVSQSDYQFSLELIEDYSKCIKNEREFSNINLESKYFIILMLLLRDRYFPTKFKKLSQLLDIR